MRATEPGLPGSASSSAKRTAGRRLRTAPPPDAVVCRWSWVRLEALEFDVEHTLRFILCEQDFTCLCGTRSLDAAPLKRRRKDIRNRRPGMSPSPPSYYRGQDEDGNYVTVCVVPDATHAPRGG